MINEYIKCKTVKAYKIFKYFLPLLGVVVPGVISATHIVGGEIIYRCLGNDQYEITLNVYRDCFYGAADAPFDDPASLGIFVYGVNTNLNNVDPLFNPPDSLFLDLRMKFMGDDTLDTELSDPCLFVPGDVCVHTTSYRDTITLPFRPGGYRLAYQRCCRNQTIINTLKNPLDVGATYDIHITEGSMRRCNSSPVFKRWPPLFICLNKPLIFDHGASDRNDFTVINAESDSLVFKMCTPYSGATRGFPKPQPPNRPPFDTIELKTGFSSDNLLGFGEPLTINSATGLMTALPTQLGQYVVGVCVYEYDKESKELLSITRRDFQYNVGLCGEVIAKTDSLTEQCDNLTVQFDNQSFQATSFQWYFDYPNTEWASNAISPTFTYPRTGTYTVQLIADPGSACVDTFYATVKLYSNSIKADFDIDVFDCQAEAVIALTDRSVDSLSTINSWNWTLTYGTTVLTSTQQNPAFSVPPGVTGTVVLTVGSQNGCEDTTPPKPFETDKNFPGSLLQDTLYACVGDTVFLNPSTAPDISFKYKWSPAGSLLDPDTTVNPRVVIAGAATYRVLITPESNVCSDEETVTIVLSPLCDIPDTIKVCLGTSGLLDAPLPDGFSYVWSPAAGVSDPSSGNPSFSPDSTTTYTVTATRIAGGDTTTLVEQLVVLVPDPINLKVMGTDNVCSGQVNLTAKADVPAGFVWLNAAGDTVSVSDQFSTVLVNGAMYTVIATDDFGCEEFQKITLREGRINGQLPDTTAVCLGEPINIGISGLNPADTLTYSWTPSAFFEPGTDTTANPVVLSTPGERKIFVSVKNQFGCEYRDSMLVAIVDTAIQLGFTYVLECNGATVTFTNTSTNAIGMVWDFGDGSTSSDVNPSHTYAQPGNYEVTLSSVYDVSCVEPFKQQVEIVDPKLVADFGFEIVNVTADSITVMFSDSSINTFGNTMWMWDFGNGRTSTSQNPTTIYTQDGDYPVKLIVKSNNGCSDSITKTVIIRFLELEFPDTLIYCPGQDPVSLNPVADTSFTYMWSPPAGLNGSPTAINPAASPTVTTTYYVKATSKANPALVVMDSVVVVVPPAINLMVPADTITCGGDVPLSATTDVPARISWVGNISGPKGNGPNIIVNPFREEIFTATAIDSFGCMESKSTKVTDQGVDVQKPADQTSCQSFRTTLEMVNLDSQDVLNFDWMPEENIISSPDSAAVLVFVNEGVFTFKVLTKNQFGCEKTDSIRVSVVPFDPEMPDTVKVCAGVPTGLAPGANTSYKYKWSPSTGLSSDTISNPIFTGTTSISYSVTITDDSNGVQCDTVRQVAVVVENAFELDAGRDTTVCSLDSLTLKASAGKDVDISWYNNPSFDPSIGMGSMIKVKPSVGAVTYYAIGVDEAGCRDTSEITITAIPPDTNLPDSLFVCPGVPTPLNPNSPSGFNYEWSPPTGLDNPNAVNPIFTGTESTVYSVVISDAQGKCRLERQMKVEVPEPINLDAGNDTTICEPTSLLLQATYSKPIVRITWYENSIQGEPISTLDSVRVVPGEGSTTYYALAVDSLGCSDTSSVTIKLEKLETNLPDSLVICPNTPTPLNPDSPPGYQYRWSPGSLLGIDSLATNPVVSLTKSVVFYTTVTDAAGNCTTTDSLPVKVFPPMNLSVNQPAGVCKATPVTLKATTDFSPDSIVWSDRPDFSNVLGTQDSLVVPGEPNSTFYVKVIDANGCMEMKSVSIPDSGVKASLTPPQEFCAPMDRVVLEVTNGDPNQTIVNYVWSPATAILTNPANGPRVEVNPDLASNFSVVLTNQSGCTDTLSTSVKVTDMSKINLTANPTSILPGQSSQLEVTGCPDGNCGYTWSPAGTPNISNPLVTPAATTTYTVTVTNGTCTEIRSVTVEVRNVICEPPFIFLPNTFTPNGDGDNDVLFVRGEVIERMRLVIFNRWGQKVFETSSQSIGWDGTFKGKELPPDVYAFTLEVDCIGGDKFMDQGNVTLLR